MPIISAIQTEYAGCLFRSRLEARWAVVFDRLGIKWDYEPQGLLVRDRLSSPGDETTRRYLPDFWFPELELWGEVKGILTAAADCHRFLNTAASISSNDGGGCHDSGGNDIVLFGPVPRPDSQIGSVQARFHMHKGDLWATPWVLTAPELSDPHEMYTRIGGSLVGTDQGKLTDSLNDLIDPGFQFRLITTKYAAEFRRLGTAYKAGRSARFEFEDADK